MRIILFITTLLTLLVPTIVQAQDSDNDGLSNQREDYFYTDKYDKDTDNDGYPDGLEIKEGYSPHEKNTTLGGHDLDQDRVNDWVEQWFNTDLNQKDTDQDGYSDFTEIMAGYYPTSDKNKKVFKRKLLVNKNKQKLYVVVDGIKIVSYPVSTGLVSMPTPNGKFDIDRKIDTAVYSGADYYYPNVKWNLQFKPHYYLHGTYWHNQFGKKPMSHGCVNMREKDAKEIYQYFDNGDTVEIIGETPHRT